MPKKVLFSAVKNEAPFLPEWIAYHRAIGFDTFLIVSNDSDDGTTELLDALHAAGEIHHIHHSVGPDESPQGKAALAGNRSGVIQDGDWVIWLDADEFLNIHAGAGMVDDLLTEVEHAKAMLIPWRIFGDSGNARFPGRFVSSDFIRAAGRDFAGNQIIKTFYQHGDGKTELSAIANHRPRLMSRKVLRARDVVNGGGATMDPAYRPNKRWLLGVEGKKNFSIPPEDYRWDLAQINHYMLRTREMFDLKAHRGRGFLNLVDGKPIRRVRHTSAFFEAQNRNEAEDRTILRHEAATAAVLDRLMEYRPVKDAYQHGLRLTEDRVSAMMREAEADPERPANSEIATPKPELFTPGVTLPNAEQALLQEEYARHDVILEYGSGGSTLLAAQQPHSLVMSVESDAAWAENMRGVLRRDHPDAPVQVHWADIGPTKKWGRPANAQSWRKFVNYPMQVWDQEWFRHPDLILIDGRFRVGCLLTALLRIERPVTVLFDDYVTKRHYASVVETFVKPRSTTGRMARFEIEPMAFPQQRMTEIFALTLNPE